MVTEHLLKYLTVSVVICQILSDPERRKSKLILFFRAYALLSDFATRSPQKIDCVIPPPFPCG